ncbi:L-aspartate oxidase [Bacillus sp. CGMCC 1.16607]|uniref:L-aspartate oxidase n=1 Tax=Bacillus sp. CGMCC 1.16607 TaxID=3351842 RepID=UPI003638EBC8
MNYSDVLIIGSGIAALQLAAHLHHDKNVRILTKSTLKTANSYLAQGGVAAAIGRDDHPFKHYQDTLEAGRFHNQEQIVQEIIEEAPHLINNLFEQGCDFDHDVDGALLLGMEGAHSQKRIVHGGGDATGKRLVHFLISQLQKNIHIQENFHVYELIMDEKQNRCIGVKAKSVDEQIHHFYAEHVILATGGCGQLYSFTSNAKTVTGDGIVLAYLAGAEIADMEFIQFHPTLLYVDGETKGLVSEAVRGEGAILTTESGIPIMEGIHPLKDLAPRHIVSQTIYDYVKKGKQVFLDIRKLTDFEKRFPSITSLCSKNNIDLSQGKIPVVPGSHFLMGGIKTDSYGRTSIEGLYAIGEVSCTGLHGANRLASNSLLEGLYQGKKLAEWINLMGRQSFSIELSNTKYTIMKTPLKLPSIDVLQARMMEDVGIVRSYHSLKNHKNWLEQFEINNISELDGYSRNEISIIFMLITAKLITNSCLIRTESRGGHFRSDFPFEDDLNWCKKQIIYNRQGEGAKKDEYVKTALAT